MKLRQIAILVAVAGFAAPVFAQSSAIVSGAASGSVSSAFEHRGDRAARRRDGSSHRSAERIGRRGDERLERHRCNSQRLRERVGLGTYR